MKKHTKERDMPENEHEFVIEITVRYIGAELGAEAKDGIKDAAVQAAVNALPDSAANAGTDGVTPDPL